MSFETRIRLAAALSSREEEDSWIQNGLQVLYMHYIPKSSRRNATVAAEATLHDEI